jgi:hypothetical protein
MMFLKNLNLLQIFFNNCKLQINFIMIIFFVLSLQKYSAVQYGIIVPDCLKLRMCTRV